MPSIFIFLQPFFSLRHARDWVPLSRHLDHGLIPCIASPIVAQFLCMFRAACWRFLSAPMRHLVLAPLSANTAIVTRNRCNFCSSGRGWIDTISFYPPSPLRPPQRLSVEFAGPSPTWDHMLAEPPLLINTWGHTLAKSLHQKKLCERSTNRPYARRVVAACQ